MYPINPFQPVAQIVQDLDSRRTIREASLALSRSMASAIHEENAEALLLLALAHCLWRDARLDAATITEMAAVMRSQAAGTPHRPVV